MAEDIDIGEARQAVQAARQLNRLLNQMGVKDFDEASKAISELTRKTNALLNLIKMAEMMAALTEMQHPWIMTASVLLRTFTSIAVLSDVS